MYENPPFIWSVTNNFETTSWRAVSTEDRPPVQGAAVLPTTSFAQAPSSHPATCFSIPHSELAESKVISYRSSHHHYMRERSDPSDISVRRGEEWWRVVRGDWVTEWLSDWVTEWLSDWLSDWVTVHLTLVILFSHNECIEDILGYPLAKHWSEACLSCTGLSPQQTRIRSKWLWRCVGITTTKHTSLWCGEGASLACNWQWKAWKIISVRRRWWVFWTELNWVYRVWCMYCRWRETALNNSSSTVSCMVINL
jgi:hypothetical protein